MANLLDFFFEQLVTESDMDTLQGNLELADRQLMLDQGYTGVVIGFDVTQHTPVADLTVDIAGPGKAYDQEGQRISLPASVTLDVSVDSNNSSTAVVGGGNERYVSVYVQFERVPSDLRFDGNGLPVNFRQDEGSSFVVVQGAEAALGTALRPALLPDALLIADILLIFGQTQILDADIESSDVVTDPNSRFEFIFNLTASSPAIVRVGPLPDAMQAVLTELNNHVADLANAHGADAIDYDSTEISANWSALKAALELQAAVDGIEDDLAQATGVDGAALIGFDASGNNFSGATLAAALIEAGVLTAAQTWTGANVFDQAQISDENSLEDIGANDSAARDTPLINTTTTTVGSNLSKKLLHIIEQTGGEFLRIYVSGNGWEFTLNAVWDDTANTWARDAAADSHLYQFTVNRGFQYIERLSGEADNWVDTAWFIAGRQAGFGLVGVGEVLLVETEGVLAAGPSVDTFSALNAINRGSVVTETVGGSVNYGFQFPANPSVATKSVIVETNMNVAPSGSTLRPNGMAVKGTVAVGPTDWDWTVTFDVS